MPRDAFRIVETELYIGARFEFLLMPARDMCALKFNQVLFVEFFFLFPVTKRLDTLSYTRSYDFKRTVFFISLARTEIHLQQCLVLPLRKIKWRTTSPNGQGLKNVLRLASVQGSNSLLQYKAPRVATS